MQYPSFSVSGDAIINSTVESGEHHPIGVLNSITDSKSPKNIGLVGQ